MHLKLFSYVDCFWNLSLAKSSSNPKSSLTNSRSNYDMEFKKLKKQKKNMWNSNLGNLSSSPVKKFIHVPTNPSSHFPPNLLVYLQINTTSLPSH